MEKAVKIDTLELDGEALNWAVAIAEGLYPVIHAPAYGSRPCVFIKSAAIGAEDIRYNPVFNWAQSGPLMEKHDISIEPSDHEREFFVANTLAGVYAKERKTGICRLIAYLFHAGSIEIPCEIE